MLRLAEPPSSEKPICLYDPESSGAVAYDHVAKELLGRMFTLIPEGKSA